MDIEWASWLIPAMSGAFGVGVTWGTVVHRIGLNTRRIDRLELKIEEEVDEAHCWKLRSDCQTRIEKGFDRIDHHLTSIDRELKAIAVWMAKRNGD